MEISLISHDILEASSFALAGISSIGPYLLKNPAIAIFLCLALGYAFGKVKIRSFSVGATVGTLVVGLLISLALSGLGDFDIPSLVKTIFFSLFIFAIGYEVGPAFVKSLRSSGIRIVVLSLFFTLVAFVVSLVLFRVFSVSAGEAGGIMAGALTQSAILGTADSTLKGMLSGSQLSDAEGQMAIAYALTYVFGTVGVVVFLRNGAPALLGVKLTEAAHDKIHKTGFTETSDSDQVVSGVRSRAFRIGPKSSCIGKAVGPVEDGYHGGLTIEKLIRDDKEIPVKPTTVLASGDVITLLGSLDAILAFDEKGFEEVTDQRYLSFSAVRREVVITKVFESDELDHLAESGVVLESSLRSGKELAPDTALEAGDVITLDGPTSVIARSLPRLGYLKDTGMVTDVSFLSIGIVCGLLIGAISFTFSGIPVTLGAGGGALVAGIIFGAYQDRHSKSGNIPSATRWFLKSVGLNLFIAVIGLSAGGKFLVALQSMGLGVLFLGIVITLLPHVLSVFFGRFVLKLDPVDIIGGLSGAGTCTAALNGIVEETGTSIFALAYTPGYAMGNILLTILGPLLVAMIR